MSLQFRVLQLKKPIANLSWLYRIPDRFSVLARSEPELLCWTPVFIIWSTSGYAASIKSLCWITTELIFSPKTHHLLVSPTCLRIPVQDSERDKHRFHITSLLATKTSMYLGSNAAWLVCKQCHNTSPSEYRRTMGETATRDTPIDRYERNFNID